MNFKERIRAAIARDKKRLLKGLHFDASTISLLKKGRRGILSVVFSRTMLVVLLMAVQTLMLYKAFDRLSFIPYVFGGFTAFGIGMFFHLTNKSGEPMIKIAWIFLMVVMPPVGLFLYLFVELDFGHRALKRRLKQVVGETEKLIPDRPKTHAYLEQKHPELARLAEYTRRNGNFDAYRNTETEYLPDGALALEAMLREIDRAEKFIFLEFFIIDEGEMWGRILKKLEEKTAQGVEVRVLYDGTCGLFRLPNAYPKMIEALGIRCKMFSPLRPIVSTHYNNRDHRKILIVDGRVAFTGGVNIADEYINAKALFGHWKDVALMMRGEAVKSFTLMFLQMWNVDEAQDDCQAYLDATVKVPEGKGWVLPYGFSPMSGERVGEMVYLDIINRAERYVHIMTPYLILDTAMLTALTFAARRGVDVAIILPHIPDKKTAFALARTHYRDLISAGVRILEYTPGFVHAKVFVSDDTKAVVGTINLDYRSLYLHFECAAYMYKTPAVAQVEEDFRATEALCEPVALEDVRKAGPVMLLMGWALKVFAPLM